MSIEDICRVVRTLSHCTQCSN